MTEQFQKFKRKLLWIRLLKSGMAGLAGGAMTGGVLHFLSQFGFLPMPPVLPWLIAAAVFLGIGILIFFLLHSSDARLAQRLDREFGLEERVQTAVAYRGEQSTMHQMQREDATAAMQAVEKRRLRFGRLWIYIVALILSAAILAGSLILRPLPIEDPSGGQEQEEIVPYALSYIEEQALLVLIEDVRASGMESPYRENIVESLEALLASLRVATTMKERDAALVTCLETVHKETDKSSQAIEVIEALWYSGDDRVRLLAEAINYYDWQENDGLDERMEKFHSQLQPLSATDPNTAEAVLREDITLLINGVVESITQALTASGVKATNPLIVALNDLANEDMDTATYGLKGCLKKLTTVGYKRLQNEWIGPKLTVHKGIIGNVLAVHQTNTDTGESTMLRVCELFDFQVPAFDRPQLLVDGGQEEDVPGGEGNAGGGAIGGGTVYGSDDLVLDPKTDTYVEYGKILNDYYALMFGKGESGAFTEEEKALLEKYFQILYGTEYQQ